MRRYGILIICIVTLAGLSGCNGTAAKTSDQQTSETRSAEEQTTAIPNPWIFDVSAEDIKNLTGREFTVPEGASDVAYGIMESGKLAEMNFTLDDKRYSARMKPTADFEDISGLFYDEWDAEGVDEINGAEAQIRQYFAETLNNILWFDGSMMYSVYTTEGDKEGCDVLKVAKIIAGEKETSDTAAYDMYGYVIDKLPEDEYYNHYNVKGDNDEIFICNYNGNDELAEGTYVGMWQIQDGGWTIEVIDKPGSAEEKAVITDENGVTVTDMEISINTADSCSFDFTLNNPSGGNVTFDQTKIRLENYDGTVLDPFKNDREPIDASAQVERHSYTMDLGDIKGGDEISVYYEGKYVSSIFVIENVAQ